MTTKSSSRPRGDIGLGDLAKILVELDLSKSEHLHLAAKSLGFEGLTHPQSGKPQVAANTQMRRPQRQQKVSKPEPRFSLPATPEISIKPAGDIVESTLEPLPLLAAQPAPDWLKPIKKPETRQKTKVIRKRLLPRNRAAGVLKASLAVRRPGRRLDIPHIINRVISGKPLTELPHIQIGSLENGVDLLCDYSESMQPFYVDLENLKNSLQKLFGKNRYRIFEYNTDPGSDINWNAMDEPLPWAPIPGRPVILASDFGRARSHGLHRRLQASRWRAFQKHTGKKKTPLLLCSPVPPTSLPRWLGRETKVIHWDPRTRAGTVSGIIGIGHETGL